MAGGTAIDLDSQEVSPSTTLRFAKCCPCHKICITSFTKPSASHEIHTSRLTKSAAPAMTSFTKHSACHEIYCSRLTKAALTTTCALEGLHSTAMTSAHAEITWSSMEQSCQCVCNFVTQESQERQPKPPFTVPSLPRSPAICLSLYESYTASSANYLSILLKLVKVTKGWIGSWSRLERAT